MLQCEPTGGSLSVGWRESIRVSPALDAYYPVGASNSLPSCVILAVGAQRCGAWSVVVWMHAGLALAAARCGLILIAAPSALPEPWLICLKSGSQCLT